MQQAPQKSWRGDVERAESTGLKRSQDVGMVLSHAPEMFVELVAHSAIHAPNFDSTAADFGYVAATEIAQPSTVAVSYVLAICKNYRHCSCCHQDWSYQPYQLVVKRCHGNIATSTATIGMTVLSAGILQKVR